MELTLIARVSDGLILATSIEGAGDGVSSFWFILATLPILLCHLRKGKTYKRLNRAIVDIVTGRREYGEVLDPSEDYLQETRWSSPNAFHRERTLLLPVRSTVSLEIRIDNTTFICLRVFTRVSQFSRMYGTFNTIHISVTWRKERSVLCVCVRRLSLANWHSPS